MAASQIRGSTQILDGTIPLSKLATGYQIPTANLVDGGNFIIKTGAVAFTANQSMGSNKLTNLANGTAANDAVNLSQVQGLVNGLEIHFVRLVAATNVTLSGEQTIDGVTTAASRVLLIGQTTQSQNGLWITGSGSWTRPADWAAASSLPEGQYVIVDNEGTTYKNTKWFCLNTAAITVDTTAVTFTQDSSGTSYTASGVLNLTGTTFSLNIGQGVENDGSNNLRVKLADSSLSRGSGGINVTPGSAGQFLVTNSGATAAAMVTASGDVTLAASGAFTVNNTAGSGFLKYGNFAYNETPSGSVNGSNTAFTLANTPQNSSLELYLNGQLLEPGAGNDYTISGTAITMLTAPTSGDKVRAYYAK